MATNTKFHIKKHLLFEIHRFSFANRNTSFSENEKCYWYKCRLHWNKNYAFARNQAKKTSSSND